MKNYIPKFRTESKSLKEFYSLSKKEKQEYINELKKVPVSDRSDSDDYIIRFYNVEPKENKHFLSIND